MLVRLYKTKRASIKSQLFKSRDLLKFLGNVQIDFRLSAVCSRHKCENTMIKLTRQYLINRKTCNFIERKMYICWLCQKYSSLIVFILSHKILEFGQCMCYCYRMCGIYSFFVKIKPRTL